MTLHILSRLGRKALLFGAVLSFIPFASSLQAQDPQATKKTEPEYGPQIHEMRARLVTEPTLTGDITDYTEVRRHGYAAWRKIANQYALKPAGATAWQQVTLSGSQGGFISGRARSIAFHPTDANTVWIATAQGGIWRTNNVYAQSPAWVNLSENLPTLAMGAIAIDPKDPNIIFAGTGETNGGFSTPGGQGLYRSKDGGLNWTLVANTDVAGTNCSQIVVDPANSQIIYVATGSGKGVLKSIDGGDTWRKVSTAGSPVSIAINAQDPAKIYFGAQGGGVYRSHDAGETWTKISSITGGNRVQVALSPSSPNIIYAAALQGSATHIHISEDHGMTWELKNNANVSSNQRESPNVNYLWNTTQGNYAHSLAVDPQNGNYFFAGGLFIVFSSNKGTVLQVRNNNYGNPANADFVHADIQFLAFNPNDNKLFCLSDGGIAYATDRGGRDWIKLPNQNLSTLQFVGVDSDRDFTFVVGGTQDNGTNRAGVNDANWGEIRGGDGGIAKVAQANPSVVYGTSVRFEDNSSQSVIFKSETGGIGSPAWVILDDGTDNIARHPDINRPGGMDFYPMYDISNDGGVVAIAGPSTVYVSESGGMDDFPIKGNSMSGRPQSIHISKSSENLMWAGTSRRVWWTEDGGISWTGVQIPSLAGSVSGITSDVNDPKKVYAVSAAASATPGKSFARSNDGGKTWELPASSLPTIPTWSVARSKRGELFMGTDFGVLYSTDEGNTWSQLGTGLPMAQVLSLNVRGNNDQYLLAGTYGRGAYYIDITAIYSVDGSDIKKTIALEQSYPNPVVATTSEVSFNFSIEKSGMAQVLLHDVLGREIMVLAKDNYPSGSHKVTVPVANLEAGIYFYTLTSNGQTISNRLVVTK